MKTTKSTYLTFDAFLFSFLTGTFLFVSSVGSSFFSSVEIMVSAGIVFLKFEPNAMGTCDLKH